MGQVDLSDGFVDHLRNLIFAKSEMGSQWSGRLVIMGGREHVLVLKSVSGCCVDCVLIEVGT